MLRKLYWWSNFWDSLGVPFENSFVVSRSSVGILLSSFATIPRIPKAGFLWKSCTAVNRISVPFALEIQQRWD